MIYLVLTAEQQEVHLVVDDKFFDVSRRDNHVRVTTKLLTLGLDVSKGARDGQSTREYAVRPVNDVRILLTFEVTGSAYDCRVVLTRLVRDGLHLAPIVGARNCLCLVNATATCQNSLLFGGIVRLVIDRQIDAVVTSIIRHDGSTVSYVDHKYLLLDEERHNGTRARLVEHVVAVLSERIDRVQEVCLGLLVAVEDGLARVRREFRILDNELVQIVTQEVGACVAAVAIEHAEEAALGPVLDVLFVGRLHDVEDDAHAVLIIITNNALISVRGVTHNESVLAHTALGRLPAGQVQRGRIWRLLISQQ